jgi:hypothetical protein
MVSTRRQKQALAAASNPLRDAGILQQVFTFLPGNWLFLGAVCREWAAVYAGLKDQRVLHLSIYDGRGWRSYGPKSTRYGAAVASPATAKLAFEGGLDLQNDRLHCIAGLCADVQTLAALRELGMPLQSIVVKAVAKSGRLDVLQHLLSDHPRLTSLSSVKEETSYYAAHSGNISMLNWLRTQSWCQFDYFACEGAAAGGHLSALQHLRNEGCKWEEDLITWHAARSGSIELVNWLRQQPGMAFDSYNLVVAANNGNSAMCKHLLSIGCTWDSRTYSDLVAHGNLEALRLARALGCPCDLSKAFTAAAKYGYADILAYVIEQGEALDAGLLTQALNSAGAFGKLQAVQWLRQHGAQWPAVLSYADEGNVRQWSGESLAWARAEGCTSPAAL